jgi:hypothetical protein
LETRRNGNLYYYQKRREGDRAERMSMAQIDRQMDEFSQLVDLLMKAELLTLGYHQHKKQWRRRR